MHFCNDEGWWRTAASWASSRVGAEIGSRAYWWINPWIRSAICAHGSAPDRKSRAVSSIWAGTSVEPMRASTTAGGVEHTCSGDGGIGNRHQVPGQSIDGLDALQRAPSSGLAKVEGTCATKQKPRGGRLGGDGHPGSGPGLEGQV